MARRAMIVVAAGSGTRFGSDKLMADLGGMPVVSRAIRAVQPSVDQCVLVARPDQVARWAELRPDLRVVPGGASRTLSEMAGLAALGDPPPLVGIHDGARPLVPAGLVETLFETAGRRGGAIPVLAAPAPLLDKRTFQLIADAVVAQTPQVFSGPNLMAAYVKAAEAGFEGADTAEVVQKLGDVTIAAVAGSHANIKLTYPEDLQRAQALLRGASDTEPG